MVDAVFVNTGTRRTLATTGNTPGMFLVDLTTAPQPRYISQRVEWDTGGTAAEWNSYLTVMPGAVVSSYGPSLGIADLDGITIQINGGPNNWNPTGTTNFWGNWIGPLPVSEAWANVQETAIGDLDVTVLCPGLFVGNEAGGPTLLTAALCVDTAKWLARVYMFGGEYP